MAKKMGRWELKKKRAIDKKAREGNKRKRPKGARGQPGKKQGKKQKVTTQSKVIAAATPVSQPAVQGTTPKPSAAKQKEERRFWRLWRHKAFGRGK